MDSAKYENDTICDIETKLCYQMPCKKGEMWKQVCDAWNGVAWNVQEEFYNPMPWRIADLLKAKGVQKNLTLLCRCTLSLCIHWNVFKVCCCVFHWNALDIYIQLLLIIG